MKKKDKMLKTVVHNDLANLTEKQISDENRVFQERADRVESAIYSNLSFRDRCRTTDDAKKDPIER